MSTALRLAIVDPQDQPREQLKKMLLSLNSVWLEAECSRYEFFPDVVAQSAPDVAVIGIDADLNKGLALLERLRNEVPACSLLVILRSHDGQLILKAMRAGANEFLTQPVDVDELNTALDRILDSKAGSGDGRSRSCNIIVIAGATGGVGCTSLAVNVGCNLAANHQNSVALVDLDLALGDADVFLDTIPEYSLTDVAENVSRLDNQLLKRSLTKHASGLYILPRPVQLQDVALLDPENLRRIFGLLKSSFSHVVVDISKSFSAVDLAAMELANEIILIVQLDLPCLRNMVRLMMSFDEIDEIRDKVKIVVNRVGLDSAQISLKKARDTIGRDVFYQIPNDYRTMVEMRNNGTPLIELAPKAPITLAMSELTQMISGGQTLSDAEKENAVPSPSSANWLNFWPGKGAKAKAKK